MRSSKTQLETLDPKMETQLRRVMKIVNVHDMTFTGRDEDNDFVSITISDTESAQIIMEFFRRNIKENPQQFDKPNALAL